MVGAGESRMVLSLEWHRERDKAFQVKGGVLVPQLMEKGGHELIEVEKLRRGLYGEHGEPDSASRQESGMG